MNYYLLIDIGSTYTKLTVVDVDKKMLVGTSKSFTTIEEDINVGINKALLRLNEEFGPMTFTKTLVCSSAAGGLKMAAIGLVTELTVEAAKRACYGAGGKVDIVLSHYINSSDVSLINQKKIDIVLLAGGTDGGNSEVVLHNARMLGLGGVKCPIIYAGNKSCQDEIRAIFEEYNLNGTICSNIMPRLNELHIDPARDVIRRIFMENIIVAKGIKNIQMKLEDTIIPTPQAVLYAAELLSKGYMHEEGLGELVLLDIGGATTDVYSIGEGTPKRADVVLKGLEEPFAKRTVEGDLGMRYSALGIRDALTTEQKKLYLEQDVDVDQETMHRHHHVEMVPSTSKDQMVDSILGGICADVAFSRHVGRMESIYTPLGMMYYQFGKDLTQTDCVIGTGGVIIHDEKPTHILKRICTDPKKPLELRPKNPRFMLDAEYILSAMGLLSMIDPQLALKIMKEKMKVIEE